MNIIDPYRGWGLGSVGGGGGGGWISGSSTTTPHRDMPDVEPTGSEIEAGVARAPGDLRPTYPPAALVVDVVDLLARLDITVRPAPGQLQRAARAAADLLRALGVQPDAPGRGLSR